MTNKNRRIKVVNRSKGSLAYYIDTLRITRHWTSPGDYLNISISELLELKTAPGGMAILEDCLLIEDQEALKVLFPDIELEPEYNYGIEEVETLLYEADIEQLLDALDFAPKGVLDLIRLKSTEELPNTTAKIEAINERFKIDLNKMHEIHQEKGVTQEKEEPKRRRRTKPVTEKAEENTSLPKYNIVEKEE